MKKATMRQKNRSSKNQKSSRRQKQITSAQLRARRRNIKKAQAARWKNA